MFYGMCLVTTVYLCTALRTPTCTVLLLLVVVVHSAGQGTAIRTVKAADSMT